MLLSTCMHRLPARAVLSPAQSVYLPLKSWWPQTTVSVRPIKRISLPLSSRSQCPPRPGSRDISFWCCATATAQEAPLSGTACRSPPRPQTRNVKTLTINNADADDVAAPSAMKPPTTGYRLPPSEIVEIVDQPPEPSLSFSPDRKKVGLQCHNAVMQSQMIV